MLNLKVTHADGRTSWFSGSTLWIDDKLEAFAARGDAADIVSWEFV